MRLKPQHDLGFSGAPPDTRARREPALDGDIVNFGWQLVEDQMIKLDLGAGVVDVDANELAVGVVVQHHAFRDLAALNARFLGEIDV